MDANIFSANVSAALNAVPASASADEAYKAFMAKLGEGFTQTIGDALGAAVGALHQANIASSDARLPVLIDLLQSGAAVNLKFSTPGLLIPVTEKVSAKAGTVPPATSGGATIAASGGSVGVTGTYSF